MSGRTGSSVGHEMKSPAAAKDIETLRIVEGLETNISGGDYISFLRELDNRSTGGTTTSWDLEEKVVLEGFRLLRFHVLKSQTASPNEVVLTGEGWVKTIKSKVNEFENSRLVAVSALLTLLTLSSLPGNYKNIIVKRGGIDCAMKLLGDYHDDNEVCSVACALLLSLCLNEKEGLNATYREIEPMLKQLVSLASSGSCGSDFALRVLFQFTSHKKKLPNSTKSIIFLLKNVFREEQNNTISLINIMKGKQVRESTVEAAISLLWRLSVPKEDFDGDDPCLASIDTIESIIATMNMFDSIVIREAACGILANISIRTQIPEELTREVFSSLQRFLQREESVDEGLAICALHAICNILDKPVIRTSLLLNQQMIETIMRIMGQFSESEELMDFACLIIARASRHDQAMKELFVSMGAFDLVTKAFERFVTTLGESPSVDVKDSSLCAFATLTGCRSGASAAMNTGLIDIFMTLLAVETDRDFAVILEAIIANTRRCSTNDTISTSPEDTLQNEPHLFSRLMEDTTNDSDASSLIQVMLGAHESSLKNAFCSNAGFSALLSAMSRWLNSDIVQENGCVLLAEIYFHLPYPDDAMNILEGLWASQNQREALKTISNAMDSFRDTIGIQLKGSTAIMNMLLPISETQIASLDRLAISPALELSFKVLLECLIAHGSDKTMQEYGMPALAVSIDVAETEDFEPWATRIVRQLMNILLQFTGDSRIQVLALDALIVVQQTHVTIKLELISSDINALLTLVDSKNKEISGKSSRILSSLIYRNPESGYEIAKNNNFIGRMIAISASKRGDLTVQLRIFSIIHALVTSSTEHIAGIAAMLYQHNGIQTLCMSVTSHPQNRQVAIHLCKIISSVIPFVDSGGIASSRDGIKFSLIYLLEDHVENPDVESAIFDSFCTCCDHDDLFKDFLLEDSRAQMIINTMQLCLGSESLQASGCKLLSILSGFGTGKVRIGNCGGIPVVVNALLAHNDSVRVQKGGLVVLKNLATVHSNKQSIDTTEAETTVVYALWIHHNDPEVTSIGLSALNNIAVDSVSRSVAKMKEQVLNIVVAAMKAFPVDELVQKNACFYLKTCSYLPENVKMLCANSDDLLPLLLEAGDNFPSTCGSRSATVVTKMTSHY